MDNEEYIIKQILKSNEYNLSDDKIVVVSKNEDRPIQIQIENSNNYKWSTKKYKKPINEVLWKILRHDYDLRKSLTRQQIHTEKGKIKRGNYTEVINFLVKRGISKEYIDDEINKEREDNVMTKEYNCDILNNSDLKLGIIKEEDYHG